MREWKEEQGRISLIRFGTAGPRATRERRLYNRTSVQNVRATCNGRYSSRKKISRDAISSSLLLRPTYATFHPSSVFLLFSLPYSLAATLLRLRARFDRVWIKQSIVRRFRLDIAAKYRRVMRYSSRADLITKSCELYVLLVGLICDQSLFINRFPRDNEREKVRERERETAEIGGEYYDNHRMRTITFDIYARVYICIRRTRFSRYTGTSFLRVRVCVRALAKIYRNCENFYTRVTFFLRDVRNGGLVTLVPGELALSSKYSSRER